MCTHTHTYTHMHARTLLTSDGCRLSCCNVHAVPTVVLKKNRMNGIVNKRNKNRKEEKQSFELNSIKKSYISTLK